MTSEPIIIVGAGCWGLATAHRLGLDGYQDITVFDKDDVVPSRYSAANDLNKVIRAEYADPFYTDLALVRSFAPNHCTKVVTKMDVQD